MEMSVQDEIFEIIGTSCIQSHEAPGGWLSFLR